MLRSNYKEMSWVTITWLLQTRAISTSAWVCHLSDWGQIKVWTYDVLWDMTSWTTEGPVSWKPIMLEFGVSLDSVPAVRGWERPKSEGTAIFHQPCEGTMWGHLVIIWFIWSHKTMVITAINPSYCNHKSTYLSWGPHCIRMEKYWGNIEKTILWLVFHWTWNPGSFWTRRGWPPFNGQVLNT